MTTKYMINENLNFSMDPKSTHLNNNFALIGAPGSGKTHLNTFNIMNMNDRSHVIVDVKGNLVGVLDHFKKKGFKTYHFNLVDLDASDTYSLFSYIDPENLELNSMTIANVLYGESVSNDKYWDLASKKFLKTILCGIYEMFDEDERDLYKVNDYIDYFYNIQDRKRNESLKIACLDKVKESVFCKMLDTCLPFDADKTKDCILQQLDTTIHSVLSKKVCRLMSEKGIDFSDFVNKKTCLVITIDDSDTTLHKVCGVFLTQLFQYLYSQARISTNNTLPIPIQFHLDDFGSYYINDFPSIISTARSRNIGISCLFQSQGQLKHLYGKNSMTIMQCFDTVLFFGGIDEDTMRLIQLRTGNTFQYIGSQELNSCYILRRGMPGLYEKVADLSEFKVPSGKKITAKCKTKQKDKNILDVTMKEEVSFLMEKLDKSVKDLEEFNERNTSSCSSTFRKKVVPSIQLNLKEFRIFEYCIKEKDMKINDVLKDEINVLHSLSNIISSESRVEIFKLPIIYDVFLDLYNYLKTLVFDSEIIQDRK